MSYKNKLLPILASVVISVGANAATPTKANGIMDPWMVGPLLAPSGHTIPKGHVNVEPYLFVTDSYGVYNNHWKTVSTPSTTTVSPTAIISVGVTNWMDVQAVIPYQWNIKSGEWSSGFGDASVVLGFQALNAVKSSWWRPDLRLSVGEAFPTGRYEKLNGGKKGTGAHGAGSYQTSFGANFQKLNQLSNGKFLRTRLSFVYTIPASTHVSGYNSYGGTFNTNGRVHPGNKFTADLAFEYTLTQHWVPALDIAYSTQDKGSFSGNPGTFSSIELPTNDALSLAPAMEYNFSANLGVIGGVWFTVYGRNSSDFDAAVMAVNYYV